MTKGSKTPKYAVRLAISLALVALVFFGGLQLFVPAGSRLTGSYDAANLRYVASAPVYYAGSESCGASSCHEDLFNKWANGAHGARENKSRCEVCHGPKGNHPAEKGGLAKIRGDGDLVELCLSCHRKMKARVSTGQPQIEPQEHPFPHQGTLNCTQCHNPHVPEISKTANKSANKEEAENARGNSDNSAGDISTSQSGDALVSSCFSCHGQSGRGGFAPILAGQSFDELKSKLTKIKSGEISSQMMEPVVSSLSNKDIDVLADYFSKFK